MKKIVNIIIGILISLYLTEFISCKISLDIYQQVFIFIYFIIIAIIVQFLISKRSKGSFNKTTIIFLGLVSIFILFLGKDILIEQYEDGYVEIVATGQKNILSNSYEVWITSLEINGIELDLENIELEKGWYLQDGFIVANYGQNRTSFCITIDNMKKVKIKFINNTWSGRAEIYQNGEINQIDLYSEIGKIQEIEIKGIKQEVGILYLIGCYFTILISVLSLVYLFKDKYSYIGRIILGEILFILILRSNLDEFFDSFLIFIIMLLIAIANYFYKEIKENSVMQSYFTTQSKILIGLCNIYITFAWIGHYLFINTVKVIIDSNRVIVFITGVIVFYPILLYFIYFIKKLDRIYIIQGERSKNKIRKLKLATFFLMFVPLIIISLGYYPGSMTPDGVDQWMQALGVFSLSNAHPAIHTLFLRLCSNIVNTPYTTVVIQILIFVLLWTSLFGFLYQKGLSSKVIYIIAFLLAIIPNNYMMLCLISKNILYALIVLWNTYLLIRLLNDEIRFFSWTRIAEFSIALALLNVVRHNGFLGTYTIWFFLIVWGIYTKKVTKFKPILIVGLSWLIISGIEGPLYSYYNVQSSKGTGSVSSVKGPLLAPAGMYILAEEEIPIEGQELVYRIGSVEEWKENYNPYNGDRLGWGKLRKNILNYSQKEAFQLYFILLKRNPLLVIKDRLHAVDILWNIIQPTESYKMHGAYNVRYTTGIWLPTKDYEVMPNFLLEEKVRRENKERFNNLGKIGIDFSIKNQLFDALFWRNGFYLALGILLVLINYIEKRGKINIVILPAFAILCTLALAASWQIYQYYWFFPLSTIYFALYTLYVDANERRKDNKK